MSTYPKRAPLEGLEIDIFNLVSKGATPEQWAEWLRAPLEHAAAQGNHSLVDKLLGGGADGSAGWKGCGGRTLLYAAAVGGSEGVASSLLRVGAQPEVNVLSHAPSGRSPLYQATSSGHEAVARLFIHAGADVNFMDPEDKRTVLHEAILGGHEQLAKELMMSGADVEARDFSDGTTALHVAASEGLNRLVSVLLLRGADKDAVDHNGSSALICASGSCDEPHLAIVETLLAAGADSNIRRSYGYGYSALDWASRIGHILIIQALNRHGTDVNARAVGTGHSALHKTAIYDQADSVDALVEAGADMEMQTKFGRTPLGIAAYHGSRKALLALLQKGATISAQDKKGMTLLHLACYLQAEGIGAVVDILLAWGADETALDNKGDSPEDMLHTVRARRKCSPGDIERVRLLLARAPADRAWRRRGWLAMLRSRASRVNANAGGEGDEGSNDAGGGVGESCKVARTEDDVGIGGGEGGQASSEGGEGGTLEIMGGMGNGVFSDAVVRLVGLKPEGVFRAVLEFL